MRVLGNLQARHGSSAYDARAARAATAEASASRSVRACTSAASLRGRPRGRLRATTAPLRKSSPPQTPHGSRRATARYLAFGVNGLAVLLMIVAFSMTAGLSGAEVAIAGGSAVLAQRLLEAIFGDQAVRTMATKARAALLKHVERLYDDERARFDRVLEEVPVHEHAVTELREAAAGVEAAR